jgi:3alpha(or 20beta)-hydroxysteroid dehydrogenase
MRALLEARVGNLEGKVAIISGAARGLGAAIAVRFAAEGARVVLGDVRHEQGRAVAKELGVHARYCELDVSSRAQWDAIVAETLAAHGRIDALVNNAAVLHLGTLEHTSEETLRRILAVNLAGPYLGIQAVIPAMKARGSGSIVNVSSIDGMLGMNGVTAYAASKWGLRGLTKSAAMELGRDGIRVNCVCPGGGNPEMYEAWADRLAEMREQTRAYRENRAIPGEAPLDAIAQACAFLASDGSAHVTGADLPVDGGASAGRFVAGLNML